MNNAPRVDTRVIPRSECEAVERCLACGADAVGTVERPRSPDETYRAATRSASQARQRSTGEKKSCGRNGQTTL
jgi:hypothetical protein